MNPWATGSEREAFFEALDRMVKAQNDPRKSWPSPLVQMGEGMAAIFAPADWLDFNRIGEEGCTAFFGAMRELAERIAEVPR